VGRESQQRSSGASRLTLHAMTDWHARRLCCSPKTPIETPLDVLVLRDDLDVMLPRLTTLELSDDRSTERCCAAIAWADEIAVPPSTAEFDLRPSSGLGCKVDMPPPAGTAESPGCCASRFFGFKGFVPSASDISFRTASGDAEPNLDNVWPAAVDPLETAGTDDDPIDELDPTEMVLPWLLVSMRRSRKRMRRWRTHLGCWARTTRAPE